MLKRIQTEIHCLIVLCFVFLSCTETPGSAGEALRHSFKDAVRQYDYSNKGFDTITKLYRQAPHKDVASVLYYYDYASHFYLGKQDYRNASRYADSMLRIVNQPAYENSLQKERATANLNKADALYDMKQYKDCYYYYCNGMVEAGKAQDSALTINLYEHLTMFLYEEGDYKKAIFYYHLLLADANGKNHTYERLINNQGVLDNMGIAYLKDKKEDSAIACFAKAIKAIEDAARLQPQHPDFCRLALGVVYGNLGQAYASAHRYREAEALFAQSIAINGQPHFANENALITQQHLAALYYEENKMPALHQILQHIKAGLDSLPNSWVAMQWNYLMSRYLISVHQPAKALPYLDQYLRLKDEYARNTIAATGSNLLDELNLMQEKYNLSLLQKDNETKKAYLWLTNLLFALAFVIAILQFIYSGKAKKNVKELTVLNTRIQDKQTLLNTTLTELEKQNFEKRKILHVVAHDLRNPLSAIHSLVGMIESEYHNEAASREFLEMIEGACTESSQLINSLLEIAENTDVPYNYQPVEVNVWLANNIHFLRMKAKEKNQQISLAPAQEKGMIYADAEKMNRVISNLVINAIKFSADGSFIEVGATLSEQCVTIWVKDNGIGIPDKYRDSIFNIFTEAKRTGTNGEKAFGLGLSISKQIVEKHSGRLWCESTVNKGTTFFIQLARLKEANAPAAGALALCTTTVPDS